jgi:hypothetical protein
VPTTSSGRSRRPSLRVAGAVGLAAAALLPGGADDESAIARRTRVTQTIAAEPTIAATPAATVAIAWAAATKEPITPDPRIDAGGLERALSSADPGTRDLVLERGLARWITDNPSGAARFAELESDPFLREAALRTVAQEWARIDPDAAARWSGSLPDATERDRVIGQVALATAEADPRAALELLAWRGADEPRDAERAGVIASWARRDFEAARAWVEAQPAGPGRDELLQRLVYQRSATDPRDAARLARALIADDAARRDACASIVGPWFERDPDAVRAWVASTDGEPRRRLDAELALVVRNPPID